MSNNSRTINSVRNILIGFLGQFIQIILGIVSRTVFIKYLQVEYLGINGLFADILALLSLADLGIGSAIIYALYKPLAEKDEEKISALMGLYSKAYMFIGTGVAIIGLSIMPFLKLIIKDSPNIPESLNLIYLFFLFNTVITYFFSYKNSIINADQKGYIASTISYLINIGQVILQIGVLVLTRNFLIYLTVQAIGSLAYNLVISRTANKMYPVLKKKNTNKLDKEDKKSLIDNIKSLVIIKLSGVLVNNTNKIVMTYFRGLSIVGICSNYNLLINIINNLLTQIFGGITASVGNANAEGDKKKSEALFKAINFMNFWLFGFSTIGILVLINDIIYLWIGQKFVLSLEICILLAINFYLVGMQNAIWTFKNTMGLFKYGKYLLLVTAAINITLSIILGKFMGVPGILLANIISRILTNIWYDPYAVYKYGLNQKPMDYFIKYLKYIVILIVAFTPTFALSYSLTNHSILTLALKLILCLIIPNIIFYVVFRRTEEFLYVRGIAENLYTMARGKFLRREVGSNI